MKEANCKNCGPLPVGEFYPNLNTKDRKPMKVCKRCHRVRTTEAQRKRGWDYKPKGLRVTRRRTRRERPIEHGIKGYWRGCKCSTCMEGGRIYQRERYAQLEQPKVEEKQEAVQLKLFVETQIRLLTRNGASRNAIKEATKAPWDLVTDVLAELWDRGEVKIKRQGEARIFVLKAA